MRIRSEFRFVTGTKMEETEVNGYVNIKLPGVPIVRYRYFRDARPWFLHTETGIVLTSLMKPKIIHDKYNE